MPEILKTADFIILIATFLVSAVGLRIYRTFAIKKSIIAIPNFRNLHQVPIPRGGGIIFSMTFLFSFFVLWLLSFISSNLMCALFFGGFIAATFGFVDDLVDIKAKTKLIVQCSLSMWILLCFGGGVLLDLPWTPILVDQAISWFALVWLMNAYNFMDGSDGLAASGAIFFCLVAAVSLYVVSGDATLILILSLLAVSCIGFLLSNWPPAQIFMGDSGSLFLGYFFCTIIVKTVTNSEITLWTWLIILAYFLGDTTITTILRVFLVKRWYGVHRSHAYQNLVRIHQNHLKILSAILLFHFLWLFPLAILSVLKPVYAPLAFVFAYAPVALWTIRYGPRLSSS
jgi:Fuc2NAc and GlcNAc transferase